MGKDFIPCVINGIDIKAKYQEIKNWNITEYSEDLYYNLIDKQKLKVSDIKDIEFNETEAIIRLNDGFVALERC